MLGQRVEVAKKWRQEKFTDGGYTLKDVVQVHVLLKDVGYVCPHGICCRSFFTREHYCPDCLENKEIRATPCLRSEGASTIVE